MSSLPGKASRGLVVIARLAERFHMRLQSRVKRRETGILFVSLQAYLLFKLAIII